MSGATALGMYWPITVMIVLVTLMLLCAFGLTVVFVKRKKALATTGAVGGLALILAGFWAVTIVYLAYLFELIAISQHAGLTAALEQAFKINLRYVLYAGLMFAALMTLGILFAVRALLRQNVALSEAKEEAQRHSRQKSDFLAAMSHELRTPLNAIIGFSEFMQHEMVAGDPARVSEYAGNVHGSASMLRSLIDDLLDLSRIEAGRLALTLIPVDIVEIAGAAVTTLGPRAADNKVTLSVDAAADVPTIFADRRAIQQVCLNLITNAIKFTPAGGSVTVGVDHHKSGIAITVSDTGIGIEPDMLNVIFEPFVQGEEKRDGADAGYGLGLRICKGLIEAHRGTIAIDSGEQAGTTVTVTLPSRAPISADGDVAAMPLIGRDGDRSGSTALAS